MASLLDPHGRPVRRQPLTERVGEPGLASVRTAWAPSVASGLTPVRLASILVAAAEGSLYDYLVLAEEMEERDAHYASVLGVRKRAVSGVAPIVTPASDDPRDVRIADDVRAALAGHDGFTDLVEDMLDALGKGFSQIELIWGRGKRHWWIEEFIHRDPRFFTFDRDTGRELRLAAAFKDVLHGHLDQTDESDLNFLTPVGADHGAIVAVKGGALLFIGQAEGKSASGLTMPPRPLWQER